MSGTSKIEWTDATWNPVTGCTKVSSGCDHCYAERITERFHGKGFFEKIVLHPDRLDRPLRWKKPRMVFVNSMSDLFHPAVPDEFVASIFAVMADAPWHIFQVLTKRPRRMQSLLSRRDFWSELVDEAACDLPDMTNARLLEYADWTPRMGFERGLSNVWLGVSVEDQKRADLRIPLLLDTPATIRFLSCEPLLGPIDLREFLSREAGYEAGSSSRGSGSQAEQVGRESLPFDWVIVGGESGPCARPMHPQWARTIRDQCVAAEVPFFFKQWGAYAPLGDGESAYGPKKVCISEDGSIVDRWDRFTVAYANESDGEVMLRVSKHSAGRLLDERTWDQMPERVFA